MMNEQRNESMEGFYNELVRRFFHPQSFFYYSITHEIDRLLADNQAMDKENSLLLGNLIDKLVEAEDPVLALDELKNVSGFQEFLDRLSRGVEALKEADYDTERMKIEIQKLAQGLVLTAAKAFEDENSRLAFKNQFNIEEPTPQEQEFDGLFEPLDEEPPEEKSVGSEEIDLISGPEISESDIPLHEDLNPPAFEEDPFEPEVAEESVPEAALLPEHDVSDDDGNGSIPTAPGAEPLPQAFAGGEITEQPESIVPVFKKAATDELNALRSHIGTLQKQPDDHKAWQSCAAVFESLAATAMIYGFEAFEQIALKARAFLRLRRTKFGDKTDVALSLLLETGDFLGSLLETNVDRTDHQSVVAFSHKLTNPDEYFQRADRETAVAENESAGGFDPVDPAATPAPPELDVEGIKLPGEDDEEIIGLLNEINQENRINAQEGPAQTGVEAGEEFVTHPFQIKSVDDRDFEPLDISGTEEVFAVEQTQHSDFEEEFWNQADLYLTIAEDALVQFESQHDTHFLYDDLELACESLKSLAFKLSSEHLSEFPEIMLELLQDCAKHDYPLQESDLALFKDAFAAYRELKTVRGKPPGLEANIFSMKELRRKISQLAGPAPKDNLNLDDI